MAICLKTIIHSQNVSYGYTNTRGRCRPFHYDWCTLVMRLSQRCVVSRAAIRDVRECHPNMSCLRSRWRLQHFSSVRRRGNPFRIRQALLVARSSKKGKVSSARPGRRRKSDELVHVDSTLLLQVQVLPHVAAQARLFYAPFLARLCTRAHPTSAPPDQPLPSRHSCPSRHSVFGVTAIE